MDKKGWGSILIGAGVAGAASLAAYLAVVRPWHLRWGATDKEVAGVMPGDEMVAGANFQSTRALTIHVPPEKVWPWLVQIGQGRGGFYSYDWLENLMDLDIHSADRILPECQNPQVGDMIACEPDGSGYQIAALEPGRLLLCYIDGQTPGEMGAFFGNLGAASTWAFVLDGQEDGTTRLVVRWRARWPFGRSVLGLLIGLLLDPVEFVMEQKMMHGIKERAESGTT